MIYGSCQLELAYERERVLCKLTGTWTIKHSKSSCFKRWREFISSSEAQGCPSFHFDLDDLSSWDSSLIVFLILAKDDLSKKGIRFNEEELPDRISKLLQFCQASKSKKSDKEPLLGRVSSNIFSRCISWFVPLFEFWGKWLVAIFQLLRGKSYMQVGDFIRCCRDCGATALPIVTLISFLTGLTMAFVGSVQLEKFNAVIYVADLVSLAMVREMGALMVAIVMAGRTGASFAAEIGSMKLNEEVDSLRTFGIPAMEFLVLPRTLALFIMTPFLTLYADVIGILGGLTVGTQVMGFSSLHFIEQTQSALANMWEIYSGLIKSLGFGLIVGLVGCFKGMNAGGSSAALGRSVTSSVVVSITLIVVCDAAFEILFSYLDLR